MVTLVCQALYSNICLCVSKSICSSDVRFQRLDSEMSAALFVHNIIVYVVRWWMQGDLSIGDRMDVGVVHAAFGNQMWDTVILREVHSVEHLLTMLVRI